MITKDIFYAINAVATKYSANWGEMIDGMALIIGAMAAMATVSKEATMDFVRRGLDAAYEAEKLTREDKKGSAN